MYAQRKPDKKKKSPTLFYTAFFLILPICAAAYMAAAVRLWHNWQRYETARRMPPTVVYTVEDVVPARPPVPAVVEEPNTEEIPSVDILEPEESKKLENTALIARNSGRTPIRLFLTRWMI